MTERYAVSWDTIDLKITNADGRVLRAPLYACGVCGALCHVSGQELHTRYHADRREGRRVA